MTNANPMPHLTMNSPRRFACAMLAFAVGVAGFTGCSKREIPEVNPPIVTSGKKGPKKKKKPAVAKSAKPAVARAKSGAKTNGTQPATPSTPPNKAAAKQDTGTPAARNTASKPVVSGGPVGISADTVPAEIVVSETSGIQPLSKIGDWKNLPDFLKSANVYRRKRSRSGTGGGLKINEVEFVVQQPGVVVMLASWSNDGSIDKSWFASRTTAAMLEDDGWSLLGNAIVTDSRDIPHRYSIYGRTFQSGEKVRLHTRKINPPLVVALTSAHLQAVFNGTPATPPAKPDPKAKSVAKAPAKAGKTGTGLPAVPARTPARAPVLLTERSNDLLKLITPESDAVDGTWKLAGGVLITPNRPHARLRVADRVPEEYDLRLTVERVSGQGALFVGAPVDGRQLPCYIDVSLGLPAPYTGIGTVDGKGPNLRSNSYKGQLLREQSAAEVLLTVRRRSITIKVGPSVVFEWSGDTTPFRIPAAWSIPQKQALYLGAARSTFRISRFELINPRAKSPGQSALEKLAVPDAAEQKQALSLIKAIFKEELAEARTDEARETLAKKMVEQARRAESDSAGRYVLLREARLLAEKAGKLALAMEVTETMARRFDVELHREKLSSLQRLSQSSSMKGQQEELAGTALDLAKSALQATRFAVAIESIKLARTAAVKARKVELTEEITTFRRKLMILKKWESDAVKAARMLATRPENPTANLERGRYLCFIKQDWPGGLRMLAKGEDADLRAVARLDLSAPSGKKQIVAVGNAWWDLSRKQSTTSFIRKLYESRAAYWYRTVVSRLDGLQKTLVEKRLREIDGAMKQP